MDEVLPPHDGAPYQACLRALHEGLKPRSYLQIGDPEGETTGYASCPSIVVDPQLRLPGSAIGGKPVCHLYQMSSDAFFAAHDPLQILGRPIDLAYLDGLHLCESLLRDFIAAERVCGPKSLILLHDCIPLDLHMAVRDAADMTRRAQSVAPGWWTGDVWRTVQALRHHRPDLRILGFRAPPTGLIIIGQLAPGSRLLVDRYRGITEEMQTEAGWNDYQTYLDWLRPAPTEELGTAVASLLA